MHTSNKRSHPRSFRTRNHFRGKWRFFPVAVTTLLCVATGFWKIQANPNITKNPGHLAGPINWQETTSVEILWENDPGSVRKLLHALDLDKPALKEVQKAAQQGDTVKACDALLQYYRTGNSGSWLRKRADEIPPSQYMPQAQGLLSDGVMFAGELAMVPSNADGGWLWNYTGPHGDKEFGYELNSHRFMLDLLQAWRSTHQSKYAAFFDLRIRDWVVHNPLPAQGDSVYMVLQSAGKLDWRDITKTSWRDLEVGSRLQAWPKLFYGFQPSGAFTPAARLLMLSAIPEQAEYLKKYHKKGHNWTTVEMDGLALTGLAFPEFKQAGEWARYAMATMEEEINRQVYPDGVQVELSTMTHLKSLGHFQAVANHFDDAGRTVPASYRKGLEKMYNYLAYSLRPNGFQPLNNDSDKANLRSLVLEAAERYHRPDWTYIATNGKMGKKPAGLPSITFPWAGINIMRSGWSEDAQWAFFDTGPFGTGHQHADMLHLSIDAYGRDLLVDGGRYTHQNYFSFDPTTWRGYFRSSFSHNVILVDGKGQNAGPVRAEKPLAKGLDYLNKPEYDYARGTFASGFNGVEGKVVHTRAVLYLRGKYWIVVDRIETDRPRKLEALWHYAPDCKVEMHGDMVYSDNLGEGNLQIVPVGEVKWKTDMVEGQTKPVIQGWHGAVYGVKTPSPTAVYSTSIDQPATFAWILAPFKGKMPDIKAKVIRQDGTSVKLKITETGKNPITVTVPLSGKNPPQVQ